MLQSWKYADRVMLLMCELKDRVPLRMTPRLFTHGETETSELLIVIEKLLVLDGVCLVPTRSSSDLLPLSLRKLEENYEFSSAKQRVREDGGESSIRFTGQIKLGVISITVKLNTVFTKNVSKQKKVDNEKKGPQDRSLGHTNDQRKGLRSKGFKSNKLSAIRQI